MVPPFHDTIYIGQEALAECRKHEARFQRAQKGLWKGLWNQGPRCRCVEQEHPQHSSCLYQPPSTMGNVVYRLVTICKQLTIYNFMLFSLLDLFPYSPVLDLMTGKQCNEQMQSQCNALVFWQGGLLYSVTCILHGPKPLSAYMVHCIICWVHNMLSA